MFRSTIRRVAVGLTLVALLAGCGAAKPADKPAEKPAEKPASGQAQTPAKQEAKPKLEQTSLKIGVSVKDSGFLPVYVAAEKGFWKQEGLDVELVNFSGGSQLVQAMASSAVQVGAGAVTEPIDGYVAKRDFKAFWGESNAPVYIWYGKKEYNKLTDLKGKGKIAISKTGSLTHQLSAWIVKQAGMDPTKDVQYVQAGNPLERVAALTAGQVDAIPATPPGTFILEKDGFKALAALKDFQPEFQYEVFYAKQDYLKANPETVKALLRGWIKAAQYAKANKKDATDILQKAIGAKPGDRPLTEKTVEFMLPYFFEDGRFAMKSVDMFLEFYKENGDLKEIPKYDAILDTTFIDHFKKNPVK